MGTVAAVATGSNYIGNEIAQLGSIWAQVGLSGFGREQELEADALGAEYLLKAGYDPQAMIAVVTALKDQQNFRRRVTGKGGGYHGVFATHPRNDTRLHEVVGSVGELPAGEGIVTDNRRFREVTTGMPIGESSNFSGQDDRNRYYQPLLNYTMIFPEAWTIEETTTTVVGREQAAGELRVEAQRRRANIEPRLFLRDKLGFTNLRATEELQQYRLRGYTGLTETDRGTPLRVAAIYLGTRVYIFYGEVLDQTRATELDNQLLSAIRTFRAIQQGELKTARGERIKWIQAGPNFTFAQAAQTSPLTEHPEQTLRILNGYYPNGEPAPGEWVKVIE